MFSPGDRVVVSRPGDPADGWHGTVFSGPTSIPGSYSVFYTVTLDPGGSQDFVESELTAE